MPSELQGSFVLLVLFLGLFILAGVIWYRLMHPPASAPRLPRRVYRETTQSKATLDAQEAYLLTFDLDSLLYQDLRTRLSSRWSWTGAELDARTTQSIAGLRAFFSLVQSAPGERLGMPSVLVDEAWHLFLEKPEYSEFCRRAFGRYLGHVPHVSATPGPLGSRSRFNEDVRTTARLCSHRESAALGLPLLFAADIGVPGGWGWTHGAYRAASEEDTTSTQRSSQTSSSGSSCGTPVFLGASCGSSSSKAVDSSSGLSSDASSSSSGSSCSSGSGSSCSSGGGSSCGGGGCGSS